MPVKSAAALLESIFAQNGGNAFVASNQLKALEFFIIPGQSGPRWIVPASMHLGLPVLSEWRPYSLVSMVKWNALCFAYANGFLGIVPFVNCVSGNYYIQKIPGDSREVIPIIYIGTVGPQQKAVVTLVSPGDGQPHAVMKVALGCGANASLLREVDALKQLVRSNVRGVPVVIASETDGKKTWQSVVSGQLTSRKLTQAHLDWLLQLPQSEKTTTLDERRELLRFDLHRNLIICPTHRQIISAALSALRGGEVPLVFVHGDFAPWNLKKQPDGKIAAIDLEDSVSTGLPLWDLCHFFFIQAHLFNDSSPVKRLLECSLVKSYIDTFRLIDKQVNSLLLCYAIGTIINKKCDYNYQLFLVKYIINKFI